MVDIAAPAADQDALDLPGNRGSAILYAGIAALLFGTAYVMAKVVLRELPPFTAAAYRFVISTAVLWALVVARGRPARLLREDWLAVAMVGLFQTTFYFVLQYKGMQLTTASNTAVIIGAQPIFVALLSALFLAEPLHRLKVLGIVTAFAGVVVLITKGDPRMLSFSSSQASGDLLVVLNTLSGAVGMIYGKRALRRVPLFTMIAYSTTIGTVGLIPFALFEMAANGVPHAGFAAWGAVVYLALFCGVIPYLLWYAALARMEASQTAAFLFLVPIISVLLSVLLLGEAMTVSFAIGAILILIGAFLSNQHAYVSPREAGASSVRRVR